MERPVPEAMAQHQMDRRQDAARDRGRSNKMVCLQWRQSTGDGDHQLDVGASQHGFRVREREQEEQPRRDGSCPGEITRAFRGAASSDDAANGGGSATLASPGFTLTCGNCAG